MLWMHERPQMYCPFAGELDSVLWYLHMAWAKTADREKDYAAALEIAGLTARGILEDDERSIRVDLNDMVTKRVLSFWSKVDRMLGLQVRVQSWFESSDSQ
ncbi:MAG: hypothetical protein RIC55_15335 [Pirellulaceae bacterium]